jgi:hypothetical protein
LRSWTNREGLEIEYIDNCFVKVPVDRERLIGFLSELYDLYDPLPTSDLLVLDPEWEFVLVAEEF